MEQVRGEPANRLLEQLALMELQWPGVALLRRAASALNSIKFPSVCLFVRVISAVPFRSFSALFASLCLPMAKRSRNGVDSDEEDMVAAMIAYADYTERCKLVCESVQRQVEEALNCYVKLRGGLSNVMVFEIPVGKEFRPELICEKSFIQDFRFSHAQMDRVVLGLLSVGFPKVVKTRARDSCSSCVNCISTTSIAFFTRTIVNGTFHFGTIKVLGTKICVCC